MQFPVPLGEATSSHVAHRSVAPAHLCAGGLCAADTILKG